MDHSAHSGHVDTVTTTTSLPVDPSGASPTATAAPITMAMTFYESLNTPFLFSSWKPTTTAEYAGTCIALIFFAALLRILISLKSTLERSVWVPRPKAHDHAGGAGGGDPFEAAAGGGGSAAKEWERPMTFSSESGRFVRAWRATTIGTRLGMGAYEAVIVGVGYVLMLAVMTMNVGYFLSVLAGVFLGTCLIATSKVDGSQYQDC
ncbi:Ctr copper transporter family-domain-containing protein [Schizothecium vesticola]|uniref:Copper transport protein n=1 Tax=Schizothecium vesticola TaxID=314040 RepID=A0AA40F691_9PEZI|nr:Ctr copper transporter family-domain-containing protein [Schizothecium vesticola]